MNQIIDNKMTPEQFTYWLQGFCEMTEQEPTKEQWKMIREHLQEVFRKQTNLTFTTGGIHIVEPDKPYPLGDTQTFIC